MKQSRMTFLSIKLIMIENNSSSMHREYHKFYAFHVYLRSIHISFLCSHYQMNVSAGGWRNGIWIGWNSPSTTDKIVKLYITILFFLNQIKNKFQGSIFQCIYNPFQRAYYTNLVNNMLYKNMQINCNIEKSESLCGIFGWFFILPLYLLCYLCNLYALFARNLVNILLQFKFLIFEVKFKQNHFFL